MSLLLTAAEELQAAWQAHEVNEHTTWRTLQDTGLHFRVTQMYSTKTRTVLCCIIPWEAVYELMRFWRCKNDHFCPILWPDKHLDTYRVSDMSFCEKIGAAVVRERKKR
jgi:aspartate aminotransferase-like enzyme